MRPFLVLPTSLLLLSGAHAIVARSPFENTTTQSLGARLWPYNLPEHQKYWPEDEALVKRHQDVLKRLQTQTPVGMRKMSTDPEEMFLLDYWVFDQDHRDEERDTAPLLRAPTEPVLPDASSHGNTSSVAQAFPPFLPHSDDVAAGSWANLRFFARNIFDKRNFQCPSGTNACTSIDRPNSCCPSDETCVLVKDTGVGDVGCCPHGQTCGDVVAGCQTSQGYSSCPGSPNGGCCIPNFSCMGVGCIATGYTTTTVAAPAATVSARPNVVTTTIVSSPASQAPVTTVVVVTPSPQTITSTEQAPATTTVFSTLPANTTVVVVPASTPPSSAACSAGFNSCAADLGGGCCPTNRICGSAGSCLPLSTQGPSSGGAGAPVRPTSDNGPSTTTTTSLGFSVCPTGYYMCSAVYIGGCCQVDRECRSTSCAVSSSTTVNSQGATIVVPVGGATGPATSANAAGARTSTVVASSAITSAPDSNGGSRCANGWYGCAASAGGGCCPSGYGCGASCTSTSGVAGAPTQVNKIEPTSAASHRMVDGMGLWLCGIALVLGGGMVLL